MKAAQITHYGGSDVVKITDDAPTPDLHSDSLLVEVHAAGVNPIDWKIREGYLQKMVPLQFPATLGGDFAGVVTAVGNDVTSFKVGDAVYGQAIVVGGGSGSFAEVVATKAAHTAHKPHNADFLTAAALPLVAVSALQALTEHLELASGQKILIHGGAGGIGSLAIQLAKHLGAYVATTARASDRAYIQKLGADEVIDYEKQLFEEVVSEYDAVFDTVGGETYIRSFKVLTPGGILVSMTEPANTELMAAHQVTALVQGTQVTTERLTKVAELVDQGALTIQIDTTFPLDQAGPALSYLQTGKVRGKVVVTIK